MSDCQWYVVRTNPRCEERASEAIKASGFQAYVPKMSVELRHNRTKEWIRKERILLVGYLFLGMPEDPRKQHWGIVRKCDGVKDVLGRSTGKPLRIPTSEVEEFMQAEEDGRFDLLRRSSLKRPYSLDERVMIAKGPFADITGVIRDYRGREMAQVMVKLLGGLVPVDVPISDLKKVA